MKVWYLLLDPLLDSCLATWHNPANAAKVDPRVTFTLSVTLYLNLPVSRVVFFPPVISSDVISS